MPRKTGLSNIYRLTYFALFRTAARAIEHQGVEIEICETWRYGRIQYSRNWL